MTKRADHIEDQLIRDFVTRGLVVLDPDQVGAPPSVHERIYEREKALFRAKRPVGASTVPEILEIINAPGVVAACNVLVGDAYAIVPFTHNTPFVSGSHDQHWHKDDNGPYNARRHRHHHAIQLEMLYYPQDVAEDMGPTATIPYSQYWTFDHEENHDNFAGADHLDFNYQIDGMERRPVNGPQSTYARDDIIHRRTEHDVRMRQAVLDLRWPLVAPYEVAPLRAGSVVIYSHNLFHRGNHRRDDWRTWKDKPRFLWRFWLFRTTEPKRESIDCDDDRWDVGIDPLTRTDVSRADEDVKAVWRHHHRWLRGGQANPDRNEAARSRSGATPSDVAELSERLHRKGEHFEPVRIGAAYRLADHRSAGRGARSDALRCLREGLHSHRENVRRAATYGLVAMGGEATPVLLAAMDSPVKWVRKAGACGLGDAGAITAEVLGALRDALRGDASVYVRSAAAAAIGCFGRRALAEGGDALVPECMDALVASLGREENRIAMNVAQNRSIKFVRPTDDSDVCEGIGINYGHDRFGKVRSVVRENALWSAVVLSSHGGEVLGAALPAAMAMLTEVVRRDENIFSVGLAMDALTRLACLGDGCGDDVRGRVMRLLREQPARSWEALARSGLDPKLVEAWDG